MPDLPFLDSFAHYLTADSVQKWTTGNTINATAGRRGGPCAVVAGPGIAKTFNQEYATLYAGAAVFNPGNSIFRFLNNYNGLNVALTAIGDGRFKITGTDPTDNSIVPPPFWPTGIITPPMLNGRWYYVEMKAALSSGGISVEVHINEETVATGSSQPWANTPSTHLAWAEINLQGLGGGSNTLFGDFYVDPDDFYGDVIIGVIRPNAAGSSTMWTPAPAVANYLNVKDITPDGDATTVASTLVDDLDLYQMEDIPTGLVIRAIQGVCSVKKDTAGLAALKLQYTSGITVFSNEFFPSQNDYIMLRDGRKDAAFLSSGAINAMEFGQKRTQ